MSPNLNVLKKKKLVMNCKIPDVAESLNDNCKRGSYADQQRACTSQIKEKEENIDIWNMSWEENDNKYYYP